MESSCVIAIGAAAAVNIPQKNPPFLLKWRQSDCYPPIYYTYY